MLDSLCSAVPLIAGQEVLEALLRGQPFQEVPTVLRGINPDMLVDTGQSTF